MNVLILYYSKTGNTRKLAEQVAEGVGSVEGVDALRAEEGEPGGGGDARERVQILRKNDGVVPQR